MTPWPSKKVLAVFLEQDAVEEVHRRGAQKAGDEAVERFVVDVQRRVALLDEAVGHNDDAVAEGHRLFLVVGDVDRGGLEPVVQALEFGASGDAELGVEVGQRLVEQEGRGVADDGPPQRDALALAAREGLGLAVEQLRDAQDFRGVADALVDVLFLEAAQLQAERHVLVHRHVRVQGVVLEDHRDVAVLGRHVVDDALADADRAAGDLLEPGDHAERRGTCHSPTGRPAR